MKTNSTSNELLMVAPLLLATLYVLTIWQQLPGQIPVHYDAIGNVNGWSSKNAVALGAIGMTLLIYVVFRFLPRVDPKRRLQSTNYQKIRFIIMLIVPLQQAAIFYEATHQASGKALIRPELALASLLMAGIGNYMTTLKPNWLIGIRTPWTLNSETVWRRTHQMGGRILFAGGLLAASLALVVPSPYIVSVVAGVIIVAVLIPVVYSYIYFRQEKAHPSL